MTQRELAKLANVSFSTVSKAFNNSDDISEETKNHIFRIAKQYGCYGEFFKGKYHKKIIAIICPEIVSSYYAEFIKYFQTLIEKNGDIPIISSDHFDKNTSDELIEYYASYMKVDGIIAFGLKSALKKGYTTPIVSVLSNISSSVDTVEVNFKSAVFDAVKLLDDYGHKKIAFLGEKLTTAKAELYKKAMKNIGNSNINVIESEHRFEAAGEDGVRQILTMGNSVTALICAYDNIAFGAIKELKKAGLRVPDDVSVIGMDNINTGKYTDTSLTTIDSNPEQVCTAAWNLLNEKIKNPYLSGKKEIINAKLIIRESIARCNTIISDTTLK